MDPKSNKSAQKLKVNLKKLPPLDPSTIDPPYQDKYETTSSRKENDFAKINRREEAKQLVRFDGVPGKSDMGDRNFRQNMLEVEEEEKGYPNSTMELNFNRLNENRLAVEDASKGKSAKSKLYEICVANNWKSPSYECCKDEGPHHHKLYSLKVVVEIRQKECTTILECFGDPKPKKKMAAEHAAEGALWYLRQIPNTSNPADS